MSAQAVYCLFVPQGLPSSRCHGSGSQWVECQSARVDATPSPRKSTSASKDTPDYSQMRFPRANRPHKRLFGPHQRSSGTFARCLYTLVTRDAPIAGLIASGFAKVRCTTRLEISRLILVIGASGGKTRELAVAERRSRGVSLSGGIKCCSRPPLPNCQTTWEVSFPVDFQRSLRRTGI